ncbi:MAG: hypothetical protein WD688_00955 [Candidatus Binatia bacterium]
MSYDTGLSMEERVTSLFQPDTLMPDQYLETFRRKLYLEPEKKLLLAVLEDAIACFQKYVFTKDGKGKVLFQEAEEWILEEDTDWLFSFANVCEMLGFEPSYLRDGLMLWKAQKVESHSKARIYQLTARTSRRKGEVSVSRRSTQRMRKAASR